LLILSAGMASSSSRTGALEWIVINAIVFIFSWRQRNYLRKILIRLSLSGPLFVFLW
jgi:hypothetical protein